MAKDKRAKSKSFQDADAPSKKKQIILVAVFLVLITVAIVNFTLNSGSKESLPSRDALPPETTAQRNATPTMSPQIQQSEPLPPVQLPAVSDQARTLSINVQAYLSRYEQAVKEGAWSELADWAFDKGLLVEANYCSVMAGSVKAASRSSLYNTRLLVANLQGGWSGMMTQMEFEKTTAIKPKVQEFSYPSVVSQIEQIQHGGSISGQSRLASLLVLADCPHGRELFQNNIKSRLFYTMVVRAMRQTYLGELGGDKVWRSSWLAPTAMNLWLIEQMIDFDPVTAFAAENNSPPPNATG